MQGTTKLYTIHTKLVVLKIASSSQFKGNLFQVNTNTATGVVYTKHVFSTYSIDVLKDKKRKKNRNKSKVHKNVLGVHLKGSAQRENKTIRFTVK